MWGLLTLQLELPPLFSLVHPPLPAAPSAAPPPLVIQSHRSPGEQRLNTVVQKHVILKDECRWHSFGHHPPPYAQVGDRQTQLAGMWRGGGGDSGWGCPHPMGDTILFTEREKERERESGLQQAQIVGGGGKKGSGVSE